MARHQKVVIRELEDETADWLRRKVEDKYASSALGGWRNTIASIRKEVAGYYRQYFPQGHWNAVDANLNHAITTPMFNSIHSILISYQNGLNGLIHSARKFTYRKGYLRRAWMLDQTTPSNIKVKLRISKQQSLSEADFTPPTEDKVTTLIQGWYEQFKTNLTMGMQAEQSVDDVLYEIGKERVGFPARLVQDSVDSLVRNTVIQSYAEATEDFLDDNEEFMEEPVWQTMEDSGVCDTCEPNDGLVRSEVDDDIPAHGYCRCYWRMVPKGWEDMSDQDLAGTEGRMVTLDADGNIQDAVVISFNKWQNS